MRTNVDEVRIPFISVTDIAMKALRVSGVDYSICGELFEVIYDAARQSRRLHVEEAEDGVVRAKREKIYSIGVRH